MADKPISNKHQARAEAKFRAGLLVEAALELGWGMDPGQVQRYGEQGAEMVNEAMTELAGQLVKGVRVG